MEGRDYSQLTEEDGYRITFDVTACQGPAGDSGTLANRREDTTDLFDCRVASKTWPKRDVLGHPLPPQTRFWPSNDE